MQGRWVRHGLPAAVSTVLAVLVGAMTNVATSHWSWGLTAGLVVLAVGWTGWEVRQRVVEQQAAVVAARDRVLDGLDRRRSGDGGVFDLLVPDRRVVPFQGRKSEREELRLWCEGDAPVAVLVLAGPAGIGKTRLALEFGLSLAQPWAAGWLAAGRGGVALPAIVDAGDPALVLVDDADVRVDLPDFLAALAGHHGTPRIRVVLIARHGSALQAALGPLVPDAARWLTHSSLTEVGPLGGAGDRERWFGQAVGRFARQLDTLTPPPAALAGRVGDDNEPMLVLLARALFTALGAHGQRDTASIARRLSVDEVVGELFVHERAWWESTASSPAWGVSGLARETRQRCILALALRGGVGEDAAVAVLRRVPDLVDSPQAQLRNAARWVAHLYPPSSGGVRIEPDLLGDWFIADQLVRQPELAASVLTDLDPDEQDRVLAVLTRVANVFPAVLPALASVWQTVGADGAAVVIRLVTTHQTPLLDEHLAAFIADLDAPRGIFEALELQLPRYGLTRTHAAVLRRLVMLYRRLAAADAYQYELADSLVSLGLFTAELGDLRAARAYADEAVTLLRALAADNPARRPDLAGALVNLGLFSGELGDLRAARTFSHEAVTLFRKVSAHDPDLALALVNLGRFTGELGDLRAARTITEEAVTIFRKLAADNPVLVPDLALALVNLGRFSGELGDLRAARAITDQAVTLWRALAADNPAHQPTVALALTNLGRYSGELGDLRAARTITEEAVTLFREVAADNPAHKPNLARALANFGRFCGSDGDPRAALALTDEAVTLWRTLTKENSAFQPDFAIALTNLGRFSGDLGDLQTAHALTVEAVTLWRALAAENPAHQANLALGLTNLGHFTGQPPDPRRAHAVTEEAVTLWRALAAENPAHQPLLAFALNNLALMSCSLDDHVSEFGAFREMVTVYAALAARDAELYENQYHEAAARTQAALVRHGREKEAAQWIPSLKTQN